MKWFNVGWTDGPTPDSGDGCVIALAQLALVAALALGVAWSGRRA